jgi:riboflavin kinase/FMN adenylyltransferase
VLNIGFSPTFKRDGQARRIEVHLIGTSCDLYDKDLSVELVKFLRPEIQFNSVDELKKQIFQDISNAKEVLAIC